MGGREQGGRGGVFARAPVWGGTGEDVEGGKVLAGASVWGENGEGGILVGAPAVRACTAGQEPVCGEVPITKTEEGTYVLPACNAGIYVM